MTIDKSVLESDKEIDLLGKKTIDSARNIIDSDCSTYIKLKLIVNLMDEHRLSKKSILSKIKLTPDSAQ